MATKDQEKEAEEAKKHVHSWVQSNEAEMYCRNLYKENPCIAIRISEKEYQRRLEEWNQFYLSCGATDSSYDKKEMQAQLFGEKPDKEAIKKILKRVETRCKNLGVDEWGDPKFEFKEEAYLKHPQFQDPSNPRSIYVTN